MGYQTYKTKNISISMGNIKLGHIPQFNLPPVKACPNCKYCTGVYDGHKYTCYAQKAYRQYDIVRRAWNRNLQACKRNLAVVEQDLCQYLDKYMPKWFRIHSAGDFYNQEYLDMWLRIAKRYPKTRFLAFTKSFHLDFRRRPRNLKIVYSVMPTTPISSVPRGSRAYAGSTPNTTQRVFECPGSCEVCALCWNLKSTEHVHFNLH